MANQMTIKRDLLRDFIETTLQVHDPNYTVVDRLRMATFQQSSRSERIEIMGENYEYAEVLYRPMITPEGQRSAGSTSRKRRHEYDVFVWYKFSDDDVYANSSQDTWDDIIEEDNGLLKSLENKSVLKDGSGNQYTLSKPTDIRAHEVVMDTNPLELGHFMNFRITVRGN